MEKVRTILLNRSVFEDNDKEAERLRQRLEAEKVFLVNVMSSPGAGKTTTLVSLISELKKTYRIGVMEADIDGDIDACAVAKKAGVKSVQLHTGGMCHLDAAMTSQGLEGLGTGDLDLVFLENVGNLVCPAEYDTGAHLNMTVLSVAEGDDKALKYPLVFRRSSLVLINKIDAVSYFEYDGKKCRDAILMRNPGAAIYEISAKTGQGVGDVIKYLTEAVDAFLK